MTGTIDLNVQASPTADGADGYYKLNGTYVLNGSASGPVSKIYEPVVIKMQGYDAFIYGYEWDTNWAHGVEIYTNGSWSFFDSNGNRVDWNSSRYWTFNNAVVSEEFYNWLMSNSTPYSEGGNYY